MAADRGDTAGQGVERVSGVRLTASEREALRWCLDCGDAWEAHFADGCACTNCPMMCDGEGCDHACPCKRDDERLAQTEAILAARLSAVEAPALHAAADALEGGLGVEGTPRNLHEFRLWLRTRAAALSQPTAAPSPDREPGPILSEES